MPAARRSAARLRVPRCVILVQQLQLFELSAPRRCMAKVFLMLQYTSPLQALHRTQTSELHGLTRIQLFKLTPRRRHRIVHRLAHRWEPSEICGIVKVLRSKNMRDDDVVEKARDSLADVSIFLLRARVSTPSAALEDIAIRVVRACCVSGLPRKAFF